MQTTLESTGAHTVKLSIEVQPDEFGKDLDRAYTRIAEQVRIPGFRKGKAPRQVIDAISRAYSHEYANVHRGLHYLANAATEAYEGGRTRVQHLLNARRPEEIIFTRNTTEAINLVAHSYGRSALQAGDETGVPLPVAAMLKERHLEAIASGWGQRDWSALGVFAAQRAGLHEVPIVPVEVSDALALEIAIVENVQREDLNPLEEAQGYAALAAEFGDEKGAAAGAVLREALEQALPVARLGDPGHRGVDPHDRRHVRRRRRTDADVARGLARLARRFLDRPGSRMAARFHGDGRGGLHRGGLVETEPLRVVSHLQRPQRS